MGKEGEEGVDGKLKGVEREGEERRRGGEDYSKFTD